MFGIDDVVAGVGAGLLSQAPQMLFNARQAAMQRDFQENMAGTQIQRRVADAEAAGINPIFAVSGGGGAAAPSGAAASVGAGPDVLSSAKQAAIMSANVREAESSAERASWDATNAKHLANIANTQDFRTAREFGALRDAGVFELEAQQRAADARAGTTAAEIERGIDVEHGVGLRYANRVMGNAPASSAASLLRLFK